MILRVFRFKFSLEPNRILRILVIVLVLGPIKGITLAT